MKRSLIIDDQIEPRGFIERCFKAEGWHVDTAVDGVEGLEKAKTRTYHLIILDLMMPRLSGEEFLKSIREWSKVPIVVVSGKVDPKEKVIALDLGADDYLAKPFSIEELKARIRAVWRRDNGEAIDAPRYFRSEELEIDFNVRRVAVSGTEIRLNPHTFETLKLLVTHRGEVVTTNTIRKHVWGDVETELHTLQVAVSNLRKALGRNKDWIENIHGVGYRFLG